MPDHDSERQIIIKGARVNNLKNINLSRGIDKSMFFRLLTLAPLIIIFLSELCSGINIVAFQEQIMLINKN